MIVNPASSAGRTARQWPEIAKRAKAHGLEVDVRLTEQRGHATALAREAAGRGVPLVLAVGGDGTVSEVADGLAGGGGTTELAIVQRGSGCDIMRTFGIPKDADRALEIAARAPARTIDLGRVEYAGRDGATESRHFINIASAGLTGVAADRVNRSGKPLGATVAFGWAAVATFVGYRNSRFPHPDRRRAARPGLQQRDRGQLPLLRGRDEDPARRRPRRRPAGRAGLG